VPRLQKSASYSDHQLIDDPITDQAHQKSTQRKPGSKKQKLIALEHESLPQRLAQLHPQEHSHSPRSKSADRRMPVGWSTC
jgi:hypothetical protein